MEPKVKKSVMKAAITLVNSGCFNEAKEIMKNNIDEKMFIENITKSQYSINIMNFISEFKNPDWHAYVSKIDEKNALDFIHFANINKLDVLRVNQYNNTVIDTILLNCDLEGRIKVLESIDRKKINDIFINPKTYPNILKWCDHSYNERVNNSCIRIFHTLIEKLNTPEVLASENYKRFMTESNPFTKSLVSVEINDYQINKLFERYPQFFKDVEQEIIATRVIGQLTNNTFTKNQLELDSLYKSIENDTFKPNLSLFNENMQQNIANGKFAIENSSVFSILTKILKKKILPIEKYNNPDDKTYTFFERFVINNFPNKSVNDKNIPDIMKIIDEAKSLQDLGIEKKCVIWNKENITNLLDKSFQNNYDRSIDDDVSQISNKLHIPPQLIQELVNFLDKRYNFMPNQKAEINTAKELMKNMWNDLMSEVVFTQDIEEENKRKIKP